MMTERLTAADALEAIASATTAGNYVLGIDGFRVVPEGFVAALDMILDLSGSPMSPQQAKVEATRFIRLHEASDAVFEVVFGNWKMGG
jgi:hypothetical protein